MTEQDTTLQEVITETESTTPEPKQETKGFTQEEVNKIVAERLDRERNAFAKALGLDKFDKETLATTYKATIDQLEQERQAKSELENKLTAKEQETIAYKQGIRPDKLQEAITLAQLRVNETVSLEEAIQQVAEEYTNLTSVKVKGGIEVGDKTTPKNIYLTDYILKRYPHLAKNKK